MQANNRLTLAYATGHKFKTARIMSQPSPVQEVQVSNSFVIFFYFSLETANWGVFHSPADNSKRDRGTGGCCSLQPQAASHSVGHTVQD